MTDVRGAGEWQTSFDELQRVVSIGVWEWQPDTGEVRWSTELYRIFGLDPDEHDPTFQRYLETVDEEHREATRQAVTRSLQTGRPFDQEERIHRPDGSMRWLRSVGQRMTGADGRVFMFGSCQDITDRKLLELRLHRCRRMETVSRMASGLAHDFNNLLAVVTLCAEALEGAELAGEHAQRLEDIGEAVGRARQLATRLQRVGREDHPPGTLLDLSVMVHDMLPTVHHAVGKGIELHVSSASDPLWVEAPVEHLERILLNLCLNARDAMTAGGTLTLEAARETVDEHDVRGLPQVEAGEFVTLVVRDTGAGLPEHLLDEIFEPFVTTKGDSGTGLGLATVDALVSQAGGFISVDSTPGEGCAFAVYWPAAPAEAVEAELRASSE